VSSDRATLAAAGRLAEIGEPFVLVTVIKAEGSTPRNAGARMIWRPGTHARGDHAQGTIGGGQFEHLVFDAAREHFCNKSAGIETYTLGTDADQCCGGRVTVFLEYVGSRARAVVFGAGHVARALFTALDAASFELVIVDERAEWNTAERYPGVRRVTDWGEGVALALERPQTTMACVMTCSHETDFDLLRLLLADEPPAYVGLIGSRSKRTSFFTRLAASGIDAGKVEAIECPIGLGDMGKAPMNVAVSIAGRLLLRSREMVDA
jgi:xanthine dehydrogenase accessory factor